MHNIRLKKKNASVIVYADRGRIAQVLSNLLSNAIKFTLEKKEKGQVVYVSAAVSHNRKNNDQGEVIVSVKDSGEGIHPDIFPRLFTKFVAKSVTGTGLGLFISKSIVETHGGRIWAKNNDNGNGKDIYYVHTTCIVMVRRMIATITKIESVVTPSGNSGHVVVPKAWIGREAIVVLKEKQSRGKGKK